VWPVAVLGAAVVAAPRRAALLGGALLTVVGVVAVDVLLGGAPHLASFIGQQTGRGLQVEAPVAGVWLALGAFGAPGVRTGFDRQLLTYGITGPGTELAAALSTPITAAVLVLVLLLGIRQARLRGAGGVLPSLSLALVTTLIVFNKVGSPQYVAWLAVPVVLGLVAGDRSWRVPAAIAVGVAVAAQILYAAANGGIYDAMLRFEPLPVAVVLARNVGVVALLGWAVADLIRSGRGTADAPGTRSARLERADREISRRPSGS
jgi:hypothetical protein